MKFYGYPVMIYTVIWCLIMVVSDYGGGLIMVETVIWCLIMVVSDYG